MIFNFFPWKIDADIEKTKMFYEENDYSLNKEWNEVFKNNLSASQYDFFDNLGIDLMRIEVEKHEFEDNEEVPYIFSINFLFCGKFLSMPKEQVELYSDEEIYGESIDLNHIEIVSIDSLATYDELDFGIGIRFKHPVSHYEESRFENWDCGFINGAIIVRGK